LYLHVMEIAIKICPELSMCKAGLALPEWLVLSNSVVCYLQFDYQL